MDVGRTGEEDGTPLMRILDCCAGASEQLNAPNLREELSRWGRPGAGKTRAAKPQARSEMGLSQRDDWAPS